MTATETRYIQPDPPYDFDGAMEFLRHETSTGEAAAPGDYVRVIGLDDCHIPIKLSSSGTVDRPRIALETVPLTPQEAQAIIAAVRHFLSIDTSLDAAYSFMERDPKLDRLKNRYRGLKFPKMADSIYEGVIRAILQQQIALTVANRVTETLVKRYGCIVSFNGVDYYAFPPAETLAATSVDDLKACGLSGRKAEYIIGFSQAVADGFDPETLRNEPEDVITAKLTAFKGIGRWTAELVMITCMERAIVPAGDLGIRNVISTYFFDRELQSEQTVREFVSQWGEHAHIITMYLLHALIRGDARL